MVGSSEIKSPKMEEMVGFYKFWDIDDALCGYFGSYVFYSPYSSFVRLSLASLDRLPSVLSCPISWCSLSE